MATSRLVTAWLPVVLWAALIFTLSSIPDLGTGLGTWDLALRKIAHGAEFAVLGFLLVRALGHEAGALAAGIAYAISDEVHQYFVPGRQSALLDVLVDSVGVGVGVYAARYVSRHHGPRWAQLLRGLTPATAASQPGSTSTGSDPGTKGARKRHETQPLLVAVAVDLDAVLGNTRPLWHDWLQDASRRYRAIAPLDPAAVPEDRGAAADELDRWARNGVGDWRGALERFAEERAPVYLRPDAEVSAALRALAAAGRRIGVFTDAPEPLARIALAHVGAERRVEALEAGAGALERLCERLGGDVEIVRSPAALLRAAA